MPRSFTPAQARELLADHNQIKDALQEAVSLSDQYENSLTLAITSFHREATSEFLRNVPADELSEFSFQEVSSAISLGLDMQEGESQSLIEGQETIIDLVTRMLYLQQAAADGRDLLSNYLTDIEAALVDLTPARGRISWLFSGADKKKRAENAYQYLADLQKGDYGRRSQEIIRTADLTRNISKQTSIQAYRTNPDAYYKVLNTLMPGRWDAEKSNFAPFTTEEADALAARHREVLDDLTRARDLPDYSKDRIVRAANRYLVTEAVNTLGEVPVEEINRGRRGFKVGLLRENKYSSVADVYSANIWELESIRGIGSDGALAMKEAAENLFEETLKTVRIRLSADRKTSESSMLVTELARYRKSQPHIETCTRLLDANQEAVENELKNLQACTGKLRWILSSDEEKEAAVNSFARLQELDYSSAQSEREALARIGRMSEEEAWQDFSQNSIRFYNILEELIPGVLGGGDELYGLPGELARQIQEEDLFPEGLLCELRRYQEWGVKYILHQERVLLGDEMGLGKTVQAIAAMVSLRNTGATHFMVICPASVLTNWCREIGKHSRLRAVRIHGEGRLYALEEWLQEGGAAVTTYETVKYLALEEDFCFSMLVVDEAHYIKNPKAKRTENVKRICEHTDRLLFMTGTALENKVEEMISLVEILQPQIASELKSVAFLTSAPQFRERIAPVYYRRRREDVLTELPELIETKEWCTLTPREDAVYVEAVMNNRFAQARRVSWNVEDLKYSSKAQRLKYIVDEAKADGRKVLVFTYFLENIRKIYDFLGNQCMPPIDGSVDPERRQTIVDRFERAPAGTVLLAQIQTGGTGLNIPSASVVVICEPQLKPSIENQAVSRAYRMGQTRNVLVYRLLCDDTIDERIADVLEEKQHIFDEFADESVSGQESLELDEKTFGNIVKEEIERIQKRDAAASE